MDWYAERRRKKQEELLKWARRLKDLSYGNLFKNHRNKLRQILWNFAKPNENPSRDVAKIYNRFLKQLGIEPEEVRRIRPFKDRETLRKEILELVAVKPRRIKRLQYHYGKYKDVRTKGLAGAPLLREVIREMEKEGLVKTARISRCIYVYRPEHEELLQRIAKRWRMHQREKRRKACREYRRRKKQQLYRA